MIPPFPGLHPGLKISRPSGPKSLPFVIRHHALSDLYPLTSTMSSPKIYHLLICLLAPLAFAQLDITPVYPLTSIGPDWRETREGAGYDLNLLAPPNGTASAPFVVEGPDAALRNLTIRVSEAAGPGGVITPGRFVIRYATQQNQGLVNPIREFSVLSPDPVPPTNGKQVIWISVLVPPAQPAGMYRGMIEVSSGNTAHRIPFTVEVPAFVMHDPYEMKMHAWLYQSPEAIAWHYGVPMWSDRHFELMRPSLRMLGRLGQRFVDLYIYPDQYFGRTANIPFRTVHGQPRPDFSFAERYLREIMQHAGPLDAISLVVWSPQLPVLAGGRGQLPERLPVTFVDENGNFAPGDLPMYGPPATEALWRTVFEEARAVLDRVGMTDTIITVGVGSDDRPNRDTVDFFNRVAPGIGWYLLTHGRGDPQPRGDKMIIGNMNVTYYLSPFGPFRNRRDRRPALIGGWDNEFRQITSQRFGLLEPDRPLINFRTSAEGSTEGPWRGFAGAGLDHWVVDPHPVTGRRESTMIQHGRGWPRMHTGNTKAIAGHGPEGALGTTRFEMLLEGIQDAEARITIERVLSNTTHRGRLPRGRAAEMEAFLYERVNNRYDIFRLEGMGSDAIWAVAENAYDEARKLFAFAAEAQRILVDAGEVSLPARDAGLRALPEIPLRNWTSADGVTIRAAFIGRGPQGITIRMEDGREFTVPLERLSAEDIAWVNQQ